MGRCCLGLAVVLLHGAIACGALPPLRKQGLKGTLVFASDRGGQWDIWRMKADGTGLVQLTSDAHVDSDPTWSPDGKRIIYSSLRDGVACLVTMTRDGSEAKRLCEGCQADWSPDGKAILLVRDNQAFHRELKTGKERLATPEMWERCGFPVFDPTGKRFAVASRHLRTIGVFIVDLAGRTKPLHVKTGRESCTPRWRPDGKKLVYQSSSHVYEIGPDGADDEQLTFGADVQHYARYSPDGTMVVFCRGPSGKGPWKLFVTRVADGAEVQLTDEHSTVYPDWRPR